MSATRASRGADAVAAAIGDRLDGSPLAVLLDVDGTLSPIAATPSQATVPAPTRDAVRRLVQLPAVTVALVSGRSADDAARVVNVAGTWVIGNHGFELRTPDGQITASDDVRQFEAVIAEAGRLLASDRFAVSGAILENKRWTLSLHYRLVDPREAPTLIARARAVAADLGLAVTEGKKVVELRPPVAVNKGSASVALARRIGALEDDASTLYAGDDQTDEDAFIALRAQGSRPVAVRVTGMDHETTGARTAAEFSLATPDDLRALLEAIAERRSRLR